MAQFDSWKDDFLVEVFYTGKLPPMASHFCARPGWTDALRRPSFRKLIEEHLAYRELMIEDRWEEIPSHLYGIIPSGRRARTNPIEVADENC